MALLYTYAMMKEKLENDLDLIDEPLVSEAELLGYINEAIEDSETAVHTLGIEDTYFLANDFIYLNPAQSTYDLPADIYANKLRKLYYANPSTSILTTATLTTSSAVIVVASTQSLTRGMCVFGTGIPLTTKVIAISGLNVTLSKIPTVAGVGVSITFVSIQPVNGARRFEVVKMRSLGDTQYTYPGDDYQFLIQNLPQEAGGNQLQLYPIPAETGPLIVMFYIRELRRLTNSLTNPYNVCELPECINFIFQHVKWRVAKKRRLGIEIIQEEKDERNTQYKLLMETFKEMVPDGNNKILMDFSAYFNQELDCYY